MTCVLCLCVVVYVTGNTNKYLNAEMDSIKPVKNIFSSLLIFYN